MAAKDQHEHHHYHEHHECRDDHDRKDDCDDDHDRKDHDHDRKDRDHKGKDRRHHHHHETSHHIHELEETIKCAADALAGLGRGAHLQELLRIIRQPGWTTPAELAFVNAILDHISFEVRTLERLQADLVEAARKVTHKHK